MLSSHLVRAETHQADSRHDVAHVDHILLCAQLARGAKDLHVEECRVDEADRDTAQCANERDEISLRRKS